MYSFIQLVSTILFSSLLVLLDKIRLCGSSTGCPDYPEKFDLDSSSFDTILKQVDSYLSNIVESNDIPGFIVSIVYDQNEIFTNGYGSANYFNASARAPNGNDLVRIASNSKVFTDLLLFYLRDNNIVNLDDPANQYLTNFTILSPYKTTRPITLRQLGSHTSGLPREVPYPCSFTQNCSSNEVFSILSQKYVVHNEYTRFHYSNLGISVLGAALTNAYNTAMKTSMTYEQLMKQIVLNKLNFSQYSGFEYNSTTISHCAIGVTTDSNGNDVAASLTSLGFENPAGGMLASANDMAKLMSFMFRDNLSTDDNINQLLDGSTVSEMLVPMISLRNNYQTIGIPWEMQFISFNVTSDTYDTHNTYDTQGTEVGVWIKSKQGELAGYRTSTALVPSYKLGVFTAALADDVSDGTVWSYEVIKQILPTLNGLLEALTIEKEYSLPSNYKDLIGSYSFSSDYASVDIFVKNNSYLMVNAYELQGVFLRLESFYDSDGNVVDSVLRGRNDVNGTNLETSCRTLEDGVDNELIYFEFDENSGDSHAISFIFMGTKYYYQNTTQLLLNERIEKFGKKKKQQRYRWLQRN